MSGSKIDAYTPYLADNVLSEEKTVTYRLLSRALKVHVNTAKQMLFEFHRAQNAKRSGTVHATYLVYGVKHGSRAQNGADEDVEMASSPPYAESITDVVQSLTLSLVREEDLKDALADFEEITSIHVYSIAPHPTKDMGLLADVANEVPNLSIEDTKKLVPINNPYVRVRERRGTGLKVAAAASAPAAKQQAKTPALKAAPVAAAKVKEEPKPQLTNAAEKSESALKKPVPALKRNASSGIMAAFSKAAAKPKKEVKPEPAKPKEEDEPMQALSDDGEDDEEEVFKSKPRSTAGSKTKKQREEELRRMMEDDDDDEEEEEEKSEKAESPEPEPEPMEEDPVAPAPVKEEKSEVVESTSNGRRRGKRKVMRKKQVMDEQGYLVTIQEAGWESFSEEEAPRLVTKPKVAAPAPAAKGKKGGAAKGQGNIMSFFSKKT
ncbi:DNA polymerase subunit Cdc27 [Cladorrhinum sp. PSN332]|nr:DNA polymerase subunit Cdc27 [Cladorrhinum sp. PSN332]